MAWSTRELSELAGTTVNTIRHYHRLGLLEEPDRRYNGYKEYGVRHLVRLLRIRRLAEIGVPLSQIGAVSEAGDETPDALREIDRELAATIEKLQKARADIAAILRDDAPADIPAGFESVAGKMSDADTSFIHIYSQLYDAEALADLQKMVADDPETVSAEVDALPADADEETRRRLAELLAPTIAQNMLDYPWLSDPVSRLSKSEHVTAQTFVDAVVELYNPAQLDVLGRASILAHARVAEIRAAEGGDAAPAAPEDSGEFASNA